MKTLTQTQISEIKTLVSKGYCFETSFHGNRKKVGSLPVALYLEIVKKHNQRMEAKACATKAQNPAKLVRDYCITLKNEGVNNYSKVLIEGNKNIYAASPFYKHNDYNKCAVLPKNENTVKLLNLFNSFAKRNINL